ncbi:hypothetical protein [Streptomyces monashensis]|uniref:Uncharacterized protein n=1 Tax=Streptomyces monashensis TaxID=1678012 RepID=A0A1S2QDN3_9ACTN|nr:hypothetical protein [Streptomyces monashensis]OIK03741.1 hypothetical protein BIV23_21070 [Streptomyces monashensis]
MPPGTRYRIPEDSPLDEDQAVAYATRLCLVGIYLRYGHMYCYDWGSAKIPLVLQADGGPPTAAARAVDRLQHWPAARPHHVLRARAGRRAAEPRSECRHLLAASRGRPSVPAVIR